MKEYVIIEEYGDIDILKIIKEYLQERDQDEI